MLDDRDSRDAHYQRSVLVARFNTVFIRQVHDLVPPTTSASMKRARNRTRGGRGGGREGGGGGYARSIKKDEDKKKERKKERKKEGEEKRKKERKGKKERTYSPEVVRAPWVPRDTRVTMHRMCTNKGICLGARLWDEIYDDVKQGPTLHPSRERESSL